MLPNVLDQNKKPTQCQFPKAEALAVQTLIDLAKALELFAQLSQQKLAREGNQDDVALYNAAFNLQSEASRLKANVAATQLEQKNSAKTRRTSA